MFRCLTFQHLPIFPSSAAGGGLPRDLCGGLGASADGAAHAGPDPRAPGRVPRAPATWLSRGDVAGVVAITMTGVDGIYNDMIWYSIYIYTQNNSNSNGY